MKIFIFLLFLSPLSSFAQSKEPAPIQELRQNHLTQEEEAQLRQAYQLLIDHLEGVNDSSRICKTKVLKTLDAEKLRTVLSNAEFFDGEVGLNFGLPYAQFSVYTSHIGIPYESLDEVVTFQHWDGRPEFYFSRQVSSRMKWHLIADPIEAWASSLGYSKRDLHLLKKELKSELKSEAAEAK